MKHRAELAHHAHGRMRLKIPAAKNNPVLLEQIKATYSALPGIEEIEVNAATGSVILYYDPEHVTDIPAFFRDHVAPPPPPGPAHAPNHPHHRPPSNHISEVTKQIEEEAEFLAEHSNFARAVVDFAKMCDRELKRATGNNVDLKILIPVGLAAFTFLEIGAAAATPMWVTLVLFSLNHFVELHAHDADEEEPPA